MSDNQFPESVTFDFRVTIPVADLPVAVLAVEDLCAENAWDLAFPSGPGLPYEHTLPGMERVDELIGD